MNAKNSSKPGQDTLDFEEDEWAERDATSLGIQVQWPLIRVGRAMSGLVNGYLNFFNLKPADLKSIYAKKAETAESRRDTRGAVYYRRKVVRLDPSDTDAWYRLGLALERNGSLEEATSAYERVIARKPEEARAHYRIGVIALRNRELTAATLALEEAGRHAPESAEIYFRLGQAYDRRNEHEKAIDFFKRALEIKHTFLAVYKNMALAYDNLGRHKDAVDCLRRAMELEEMAA